MMNSKHILEQLSSIEDVLKQPYNKIKPTKEELKSCAQAIREQIIHAKRLARKNCCNNDERIKLELLALDDIKSRLDKIDEIINYIHLTD